MMARMIIFPHQLLVLLSLVSSSCSFLSGSAHAQNRQNSIWSRQSKVRNSGSELFDLLKQLQGTESKSDEESGRGDARTNTNCQSTSSCAVTFRIPRRFATTPRNRVRSATSGLSRVRQRYRKVYTDRHFQNFGRFRPYGISTRDGISDNNINAFKLTSTFSFEPMSKSPRNSENEHLGSVFWRSQQQTDQKRPKISRWDLHSESEMFDSTDPRPDIILPFLSQHLPGDFDSSALSEEKTSPNVNSYGGFVGTKNSQAEKNVYVRIPAGRLSEEMLMNDIEVPELRDVKEMDDEEPVPTILLPSVNNREEVVSKHPGEAEEEEDYSDPEFWPLSGPDRTQTESFGLEAPFEDDDYDSRGMVMSEAENDEDLDFADSLLKLEHEWSLAGRPRQARMDSELQDDVSVTRFTEADLPVDSFERPRKTTRQSRTNVFPATSRELRTPQAEPQVPTPQKKLFTYGRDDRLRVFLPQMRKFPFSNIARLSTGCTGTLVTPRHVLTAAHCVHNGKDFRNNLEKLKIEIPDTMGFKDYYAAKIAIPTGWLATNNGSMPGISQSRQRAIYDYAVVSLKLAVAGHTHFLPLAVPRPEVLQMDFHFLAFPENDQQLWRSVCQASKHMALGDGNLIMTRCDAAVGNSGAAVFTQDPHDGLRVVGILSNTMHVAHHRSFYRYSIITALTWPKLNVICSDLGILGQRYKVCPRAWNMRRSHSPPKVKAIPFFG